MSDSDTWLTPPELIAALGPFDLDPCAAVGQPWATAVEQYTIHDNGLALPWSGLVWLNPPFSDPAPWVDRLVSHGDGIALLPASVGVRYWQDLVFPRADLIVFLRGRPRFLGVTGQPGPCSTGRRDIAICAFGKNACGRVAFAVGAGKISGYVVLP